MREDWIECNLDEVCYYSKGKKPPVLSSSVSDDINVPYINIKAFEKGIIDEFTNGEKCNLCEDGDLLMVWDGARSGLTGKAKKGAVGSTLMKIEEVNGIEKEYLFYFLLSLFTKINTNPRGVGIPHVEPRILWLSKILIVSSPIQRAIVSKIEALFSDLDNGIANFKKAQEQLKVYRQAVLKKAFEGGFSITNEELRITNEENQDNHTNQKNHSSDNLPKGWKWVKISEIAETFGGFAFKSKEFSEMGNYQVIRMGNVRPGLLRLNESPVFLNDVDDKVLKKSLLQIDDIIITQTGTKGKRDYGFTTLINKPNLLLNQRIAAIRCNEKCNSKYLLYFTWTDEFKDQFFANETGNVGQGNVGMKAVTDTLVVLPSNFQEQTQIVQEIESRLSVCDNLEFVIRNSIEKAEALRQSILKKAFEGKLLSEAEIAQCKAEADYESASELLKKIQAEKAERITNGKLRMTNEKQNNKKPKNRNS